MEIRIPGYYWAKYNDRWVLLQWSPFFFTEIDSAIPVRGCWWEMGSADSLSENAETYYDIISKLPIKPPEIHGGNT